MTDRQRNLTPEEWEEIKKFLNHCNNNAFVIEKTGRSRATIGRVKQSSSFEEYETIRKGSKGAKVKKPEQIEMPWDSLNEERVPNDMKYRIADIATKLRELADLISGIEA